MKKSPFYLILIMLVCSVSGAFAQYDDVYFDPSDDANEFRTSVEEDGYEYESTETYDGEEELTYYAEEDYEDAKDADFENDDYDYYYSSRIKRFRRSYSGFNYYDPCYVDTYYYNPSYRPGTNIYTTGYYGNSWNAWNSPNNTTIICDPYTGEIISVVNNNGYNSYNNPYGYNYASYNAYNYSSNAYGYNGFNSFNDPLYCAPGYYGNTIGNNIPVSAGSGGTFSSSPNYVNNGPRATSSTNASTSTSTPTTSNPRTDVPRNTYSSPSGSTAVPRASLGKGGNNEVTPVKSTSSPTFNTTKPRATKPRTTTTVTPRTNIGLGKSNSTTTKPKVYTKPSPRPKTNYSAPKSTTPRTYSAPKSSTPRSYSAPKSSTPRSYSAPKSTPSRSTPSRSSSPGIKRGGK